MKNLRGFTVIETLVAITILLLSIIGPMEIASKGLFTAMYARDEITAFYLGQEAIEYIRNARDTTYIVKRFKKSEDDNKWLEGLDECIPSSADSLGDGCILDATKPFTDGDGDFVDGSITACDGSCSPLNYDDGTGLYSYNSGYPASKYTRTVKLIPKDNRGAVDEEALIEVTVKWNSGSFFSGERTFVIREMLFNWRNKD